VTEPPRTVDEVAAPYANFLVRVPPARRGVCRICHTVVGPFQTCLRCKDTKQVLGQATADLAAFVSMAPNDEQLAHELHAYKRATVPRAARDRMATGLAAVLWKWLDAHEECLVAWLGIDRFDVTTSVPSTSGRRNHPLKDVVADIVSGTEERYEDLLTLARTDLDPREDAADRFRARKSLDGARVLILDDTWTTGAKAQSASAALKAAGAGTVAVVTIGRWFNPTYNPTGADAREWLAEQKRSGWDWDRCCLDPD
jgi:predicted amidophosphoribosyltransferase